MHRAAFLFIALIAASAVHAQNRQNTQGDWLAGTISPGGHRGAVTALIHRGNEILSAGEDGFLEIWNVQSGEAAIRFQLTPYSIKAMADRPEKDEICLVESDGLGLYRISAWNYRERKNIFTLRFRDPVSFITYSAGGNFIIAARSGRTGLVFIDAQSGSVIRSPETLTGNIAYAATGRSERNMLVYLLSGEVSYWDLESGDETYHFEVPPNLHSPIVFANHRYLAGIDSQGLVILDAASGNILDRNNTLSPFSMLCAWGNEFFCLSPDVGQGRYGIYHFGINRSGKLVNQGHYSLTEDEYNSISVMAANGSASTGAIALGTTDGGLLLIGRTGQNLKMKTGDQIRISEIAVSGSTIAFLAANNTMGFLPLDYRRLNAAQALTIEQNERYSRLSPFADGSGSAGQFIFWQDDNTSVLPEIRSANGPLHALNNLSFRFPLRSVSSAGGNILFLDSAGNLSVVSPLGRTNSRPFTFSTVGLMAAALIDRNNVILGRSAISGNSPFLLININTGETVPLSYPSHAGIMVYPGRSGSIYAAAVEDDNGEIKTSILRLNTTNPAQSLRLVELHSEDTQFSLAESSGQLAATIGGEGAAIYSTGVVRQFERSPGLPLLLMDGGDFFISLDADGNICWHESRGGTLLAIFRLYQQEWILQTGRGLILTKGSNINTNEKHL
jgi:WD40 repeat protein